MLILFIIIWLLLGVVAVWRTYWGDIKRWHLQFNCDLRKDNTFNILKDDPRYLSGELKSINSGTITINNGIEMKRVQKDSVIPIGWTKGMIKRKK